MTLNSYLLIDGALRQTAIKDMYAYGEALQIMPLYIGTPYGDNYDIGPILVGNTSQSDLLESFQQFEWADAASLIKSHYNTQRLFDHLRQFTTVTDESGSHALFRFADPVVTYYWLNSYDNRFINAILGPIAYWQVRQPKAIWHTDKTPLWQFFTIKDQSITRDTAINYLDEPQVKALEAANDFRFKNKLFTWLSEQKAFIFEGKTESQITYWINYCYEEAGVFNLISERSYAMWMELCAEYGHDFASRAQDNLYKNWLTMYPQYKKLPVEVTIQKFYDYLTA